MVDTNNIWKNSFGIEYTRRNPKTVMELDTLIKNQFGKTKTSIYKNFIKNLDIFNVLQVGCNIGLELVIFKKLGLKYLSGVDINRYNVDIAKKNKGIDISEGNVFNLPFKNDFFDMVFTDGLLIHINPNDLPFAMDEIVRVSKKYIMGFEYFSPFLENINYRGKIGVLWKHDYCGLYLDFYKNLVFVKYCFFEYKNDKDKKDVLFLLKKNRR